MVHCEESGQYRSYFHLGRRLSLLLIPVVLFFLYWLYVNQKTETYTIFYTNDAEGHLLPQTVISDGKKRYMGGYAILSSFIKKQPKPFLLLDAGRTVAGSPEADATRGAAVIQLMNMTGYTAMAVGTRELEWGHAQLERFGAIASFPLLCANIVRKSTQQPPKMIAPYSITQLGDLKVGIIGLADPYILTTNLEHNVADLTLLPLFQTVRHYVSVLREREHVDMVILISQSGVDPQRFCVDTHDKKKLTQLDSITIANEVPGIDVIISGGIMRFPLHEACIAGTAHTVVCQTGGSGNIVGKLQLVLRVKDKKIVTFSNTLIPLWEDQWDRDVSVAEYIEHLYKHEQDTIIGETKYTIGQNNQALIALVTNVMREKAGTDIALFRFSMVKEDIVQGKISYRMVHSALPFNDRIIKITLTGKQLERGIAWNKKNSDARVTMYIDGIDVNDEQATLHATGKPIEPDTQYIVAIVERMLNSLIHGNVLHEGTPSAPTTWFLRDAVIDYIQTHVPLTNDEQSQRGD